MENITGNPYIIAIDTENLPPQWIDFSRAENIALKVAVLYDNPAATGKVLPAKSILERGVSKGSHQDSDTIIDSTSGNYGVSAALVVASRRCDPSFPIRHVKMVIPKNLSKGKRRRLTDCGIEVIEADDSVVAMGVAREIAEKKGYWYTNQYQNPHNSHGYRNVAEYIGYTMPDIGVIAWGVGSGGGCSGVMPVLRAFVEDRPFPLQRVAVVVENGQKVGGVRDEASLRPVTLEWRAPHIEDVRFVGEEASYCNSAALWRQEPAPCYGGPSTGFAVEGAFLAMRSLYMMGRLDHFRDNRGLVNVLVPAMDTRMPYREEYEERGIYF